MFKELIFFNELQLYNASSPRVSTFGIDKDSKDEQPEKAAFPIVVTCSNKLINFNELHPTNALSSINVTFGTSIV